MIYKCFALLCMGMLFSTIHAAQYYSQVKQTNVWDKNHKSHSFISVKGKDPIAFSGGQIGLGDFVPLSFPHIVQRDGDDIQIKKHKTEFHLKKGTYLVSFTGTFDVNPDGSTRELGIRIGSAVVMIFAENNQPNLNHLGTNSFSEIVHVDKPSALSIVAREFDVMTTTTALNRSLSIVRLDE